MIKEIQGRRLTDVVADEGHEGGEWVGRDEHGGVPELDDQGRIVLEGAEDHVILILNIRQLDVSQVVLVDSLGLATSFHLLRKERNRQLQDRASGQTSHEDGS